MPGDGKSSLCDTPSPCMPAYSRETAEIPADSRDTAERQPSLLPRDSRGTAERQSRDRTLRARPWLYFGCISVVSRLYLGCLSAVSRLSLGCISAVSRRASPLERPHGLTMVEPNSYLITKSYLSNYELLVNAARLDDGGA